MLFHCLIDLSNSRIFEVETNHFQRCTTEAWIIKVAGHCIFFCPVLCGVLNIFWHSSFVRKVQTESVFVFADRSALKKIFVLTKPVVHNSKCTSQHHISKQMKIPVQEYLSAKNEKTRTKK